MKNGRQFVKFHISQGQTTTYYSLLSLVQPQFRVGIFHKFLLSHKYSKHSIETGNAFLLRKAYFSG